MNDCEFAKPRRDHEIFQKDSMNFRSIIGFAAFVGDEREERGRRNMVDFGERRIYKDEVENLLEIKMGPL